MNIDMIGVPLDFGAGRRGVDMGPSALRYAGMQAGLQALGHEVRDLGNIAVPPSETCEAGEPRLRYLEPIVRVQKELATRVAESLSVGHFPLVLGGDHSLGLGSIAGASSIREVGVIWMDTHGDFNTSQTSPSGNIHGMPLAALCGFGDRRLVTLEGFAPVREKVNPRNVVVVGARDLDPDERSLMRGAGVTVFSMSSIDRHGIHLVMEKAIEIASHDTEGIFVSFDLDVVDPDFAPGVGTPFPGGLSIREAHLAMEMLSSSGRVLGLDVVEVNPILDRENMTARLAVDLTLSALGKSVWFEHESDRLLQGGGGASGGRIP